MKKYNSVPFFLAMILIFLDTVFSDNPFNYILSIRANAVSPYAKSLFETKTFTRGSSVDSSTATDIIVGDQYSEISADIVKYNGDIGTDVLSLDGIFRNGDYVSQRAFYVNYTYAGNKYYTNPQPSTYSYEESVYEVACRYKSNDVRVTAYSPNLVSVNMTATYSYVTFALMTGNPGVYMLKYNNSLTALPLDSYVENADVNFNKTSYKGLWVVNQEYNNYVSLVLQESGTNSLVFYNVSLTTNSNNTSLDSAQASDLSVKLNFFNKVSFNYFNTTNINKIGVFKDYVLIATDDKGLISLSALTYDNNGTILNWRTRVLYSGFNSTSNSTTAASIADFVVNEKTIYLIEKGRGLVILDLTNDFKFFSVFLTHPSLVKLDFLVNPFLGSKYVGVSVRNGNEVFEFFYEFIIDNEFDPLLNKVFTTDEIVLFDDFFTVDKFFTYIFNKISNKLIIIRRGMINSIPSELYSIDLSKPITSGGLSVDTNPIIGMYDFNSGSFFPAILSNSYFLFLNVVFPYDTLTCRFAHGGFYNISMTLKGEVCAASMESSYQYTSCDKLINITYFVYGDASGDNIGIIVGIVCVCGGFVGGIFGFILYKSKCCTDFDAFKLEDKENLTREVLYRDSKDNSRNPEEEILDQPVASEYQLGTVVDGRVLGNVIYSDPSKEGKEKMSVNVVHDAKIQMANSNNAIIANNLKKEEKVIGNQNSVSQNAVIAPQYSVNRTVFKKKSTKNTVVESNTAVNLVGENITVNKKDSSVDKSHDGAKKDFKDNSGDVKIVNAVLPAETHNINDEFHGVEFKQVELVNATSGRVIPVEEEKDQLKKSENLLGNAVQSEALIDIDEDQENLKSKGKDTYDHEFA